MFGKSRADAFFNEFSNFAERLIDIESYLVDIVCNNTVALSVAQEVKNCESYCDGLLHEILEHLYDSFITPFDREDIIAIANNLDDIADYIEDTVSKIVICDIIEFQGESIQMCNLIENSVLDIWAMFESFRQDSDLEGVRKSITNINQYENDGDIIYRSALTRLFREDDDPVDILRWNCIYEGLENTLDACERLAETIEGVIAKNA